MSSDADQGERSTEEKAFEIPGSVEAQDMPEETLSDTTLADESHMDLDSSAVGKRPIPNDFLNLAMGLMTIRCIFLRSVEDVIVRKMVTQNPVHDQCLYPSEKNASGLILWKKEKNLRVELNLWMPG